MRNRDWLRYGLASMIVAGAGMGALLAACGDDDDVGPGTGPDTGSPDAPKTDGGGGDAADAAKVDAGSAAKLTFVNGATDLGPGVNENGPSGINGAVRFCFETAVPPTALSVGPYPPLPDRKPTLASPGIPYGTGGTFPSFGLDLSNRILKPYIMSAKALRTGGILNPDDGTPGTTCDEIVGATKKKGNFVENTDFWILDEIPAGTLLKEKAYVGVLTGCAGDSTLNPGTTCGAGFTPGGAKGRGNLKITIYETNRVPVDAAKLGVQFLHASPQTNAVFGPGGAAPRDLTPGFVDAPDGGSFDASTYTPAVSAPIVLNTLTPALGVTGTQDTDFFALNQTGGSNNTPLAPLGLRSINALSGFGEVATTIYKDGKNFVFIAVGDPTAGAGNFPFQNGDGGFGASNPDGGDLKFNTRFFHFLAFPTDPVIEPYAPK
jgi:hypothetical protein